MSDEHISRVGIVDSVSARRHGGEVKHLRVRVRVEADVPSAEWVASGETKVQIDEISLSLPVESGVNPGDIVVLSASFKSPFGERFQPALEIGEETVDASSIGE